MDHSLTELFLHVFIEHLYSILCMSLGRENITQSPECGNLKSE